MDFGLIALNWDSINLYQHLLCPAGDLCSGSPTYKRIGR